MSSQKDTEIKWWHKVFLILGLAMGLHQIKGCLGLNAPKAQDNRVAQPALLSEQQRDACNFIPGKQYPYHWEGSNVGACVTKLPPQPQTAMIPDPFGGPFEVSQTTWKNNLTSISSPIGEGVGEFNGNYVVGIISTSQGDMQFVCAGAAVTGSSRGICGLR